MLPVGLPALVEQTPLQEELLTRVSATMIKRSHARLYCGPAIVCLLDCVLTLYGQPPSYWAGQYHQAVEYNPPFLWLLRLHPLAFSIVALA